MSRTKGECLRLFAGAQPGWKVATSDRDPMALLPRGWTQRKPAESIKYAYVPDWPDPRKRLWRPCDDVFEHPDWFLVGRHPVAVVHLYNELDLANVPEGIIIDELPESWYYPGHTRAYVYRPPRSIGIAPQSTGIIRETIYAGEE
jgi:hypothetical protein